MDDKSTAVDVGEGNVGVETGTTGGPGTNVQVGKGTGVGVSTGAPGDETDVGVGKGGVVVRSDHKGKPVYVGVSPGSNPFIYNYAASAAQLHDDPNVALFLGKRFAPGSQHGTAFYQANYSNAFFASICC